MVDKLKFLKEYNHLMDHTHDVPLVRSSTPFIALVFAMFACASRIVEDVNLSGLDDSGMEFYERLVPVRNLFEVTDGLRQCPNSTLHQPRLDSDRPRSMFYHPILLFVFCELPASGLALGWSGRANGARSWITRK